MNLSEEEWEKVQDWLAAYRVCLHKESKKARHPKIKEFYDEISGDVHRWMMSKEDNELDEELDEE